MEPQRITSQEIFDRLAAGERLIFLDTRADEAWRSAKWQIPGSIRVPPDAVEDHLDRVPIGEPVVTYCTCPDERSSVRAARALLDLGWPDARALSGGLEGWRIAGGRIERRAERHLSLAEAAEHLHQAEGDEDESS